MVRVARKMPVTFFLLAQYAPLVLWPGLVNGTDMSSIWPVFGLAVLATGVVEVALFPLGPLGGRHSSIDPRAITIITVIGFVATGLAALQGAATFATQVGSGQRSPLAAAFTPFTSWSVTGPCLMVYAASVGDVAPRRALRFLAAATGAALLLGLYSAILQQAIALAVLLGYLALTTGMLRLRTALLAVVLAVTIWPTVYDIRNNQRFAYVTQAQLSEGAANRLRLDLNMARMDHVADVGTAEQESAFYAVRVGLVPSIIDRGRPDLSTGKLLNRMAFDDPTSSSSYSFTILGNLYLLQGSPLVVAYCAVGAGLAALLFRMRGPGWFIGGALLLRNLFAIETVYPDSVAALLQAGVAGVGAWVVFMLVRRRRMRPPFRIVWRSRKSRQMEFRSLGGGGQFRRNVLDDWDIDEDTEPVGVGLEEEEPAFDGDDGRVGHVRT